MTTPHTFPAPLSEKEEEDDEEEEEEEEKEKEEGVLPAEICTFDLYRQRQDDDGRRACRERDLR